MRKKIYLTKEQKIFIRVNYPDMTIFELTQHLKISTSRIGKFLKENNLNLSNGEAKRHQREKRIKKIHKVEVVKPIDKPIDKPKVNWISNPWDKKLNLVTMQRPI